MTESEFEPRAYPVGVSVKLGLARRKKVLKKKKTPNPKS